MPSRSNESCNFGRNTNSVLCSQTARKLVSQPSKSGNVSQFCADMLVETGVALQCSGDSNTSMELFQEALEIYPQHDVALFEMGVNAMAKGLQSEAISFYKRAVQANPSNVQVCDRHQ